MEAPIIHEKTVPALGFGWRLMLHQSCIGWMKLLRRLIILCSFFALLGQNGELLIDGVIVSSSCYSNVLLPVTQFVKTENTHRGKQYIIFL
jgi:hypothetical protein